MFRMMEGMSAYKYGAKMPRTPKILGYGEIFG